MANFHLETFIGLHIFLVSADLIFNILNSFINTFSDNLIVPLINILVGKFIKSLKWKVGEEEEDIIDLSKIIKEIIRLIIISIFIFYVYVYFKKYKKYRCNLK